MLFDNLMRKKTRRLGSDLFPVPIGNHTIFVETTFSGNAVRDKKRRLQLGCFSRDVSTLKRALRLFWWTTENDDWRRSAPFSAMQRATRGFRINYIRGANSTRRVSSTRLAEREKVRGPVAMSRPLNSRCCVRDFSQSHLWWCATAARWLTLIYPARKVFCASRTRTP